MTALDAIKQLRGQYRPIKQTGEHLDQAVDLLAELLKGAGVDTGKNTESGQLNRAKIRLALMHVVSAAITDS